MANLSGFDATTVEPAREYVPIPNGDYLVIITESEMKPTSKGDGSYLELKYQLIGETIYKNRTVKSRHNLDNKNETAVQIAQSELSSICRACKILKPNDSCELHNIPLMARIVVSKNKDTKAEFNEIKGWKAKGEAAATGTAPAAGGPPPWQKKTA